MKKYILLLLISCSARAVHVNPNGTGDVLLAPYYSVNNQLNTVVGVTNTTQEAKALKINVREGLNGYAVLSYSVYLGPYDTWTFVMGAYPSSVEGYVGQDFAAHASTDNSCAPTLNKALQEFDPTVLVDGSDDISRGREGFIEIIEMGELQGHLAGAVIANSSGFPENCSLLENAWEPGDVWHTATGGDPQYELLPGSGGLMAEVDIIDVGEGINYSIPVVALDGFFAEDSVYHVSPSDSSLSLDAAAPLATVITENKTYQLSFDRGIDAVSAVLMSDELIGTYALETGVLGKTETVLTQPTRRFYLENEPLTSQPPYADFLNEEGCSLERYGGVEVRISILDRETQIDRPDGWIIPTPTEPNPALCGSVFVHLMMLHPAGPRQAEITQSENYGSSTGPTQESATENGIIRTQFLDTRPLTGIEINSGQSVQVLGLPVIGVTLGQFTNAQAGEGLLAQYGMSHLLKSRVKVVEE